MENYFDVLRILGGEEPRVKILGGLSTPLIVPAPMPKLQLCSQYCRLQIVQTVTNSHRLSPT